MGVRPQRHQWSPSGRPVEKPVLGPIPDIPENVALALMGALPKAEGEWEYLKKAKD